MITTYIRNVITTLSAGPKEI